MKARLLFEAGKVDEAIEALSAELRGDPTDVRRRTFLFELLCFAGEYDRAAKQLDVIAGGSREAELGALLYRGALHAERLRQQMFEAGQYPEAGGTQLAVSGTLNGRPFTTLTDADPRIGARLEVFAAGQYMWLPLEHVAAVRMESPRFLRDLLWAPARVVMGPRFRGHELGEVLIPAISPLSWRHPDGNVRLGRVADWQELEDGTLVPVGAKVLLVDDEPIPLLELRELEISVAEPQPG